LADIVGEAAADYQKPGLPVEISFGASSTLARQILTGVRADVYISAHEKWIERLQVENLVGTAIAVAGNELVLAGATSCPRIAVGDPEHVPVGMYAKEALRAAGLWESWKERFVPMLDARAAAATVQRGEIACAIVYRTDAIAANIPVRQIFKTPTAIRYPAVVLKATKHAAEAQRFVEYLRGEEKLWVRHGFKSQ
jgi:molybdate transport system substrate-binding protein